MTTLQIIGISWGVLGLLSALVFGAVITFTMDDPKSDRVSITCLLLLFGGLFSVIFTGAMIFYMIRLAQAQAWWEAIGTQEQARLINKPLVDYMLGRYTVAEELIITMN